MKHYRGIKIEPTKQGREILPAGGYVARIKSAVVEENNYGDRLLIYFDVAEGSHKDFFQKDWDGQTQEDRRWKGCYRAYLPKDDGSQQDEWSRKTLGNIIWSLEESNPGFHFDWNENELEDKLIGVLFRNREWEFNGNSGWTTECSALKDVNSIRTGKFSIPKDKPLPDKKKQSDFPPLPDDDDCPF